MKTTLAFQMNHMAYPNCEAYTVSGRLLELTAHSICELQAETIVRRFPSMRIASLRLHWSVPNRAIPAARLSPESAAKDLWAYVHEDSAADAFLLALEVTTSWSGHEAFFITAPEIAAPDMDSEQLRMQYWPNVPLKNGVEIKGRTGFFDCSKAQRLLGWVHVEP